MVKALSNMFFPPLATLGRPPGAPNRSALPIAGNDLAAKTEVAALLSTLGYDVLDAGPLIEARRYATFGTPANRAYLDPEGGFAAPGRPASAAAIGTFLRAVP